MGKWIGKTLNMLESRLSLWNLLNGGILVTSIGFPIWAVNAIGLFSEYSPLSWVLAGFMGALGWALIRIVWVWGKKAVVSAKYDATLLERGDKLNPLDLTFESKRIYINDLVLPSHPVIIGKTFINCEIIGPANIYFLTNNLADPIMPPIVDGVWLAPDINFNNGFVFSNCIFRSCSFQRITIFAGIENYNAWKDNKNVNWISIPPTEADLDKRMLIIRRQPNQPTLPAPRETGVVGTNPPTMPTA